jgi:hypothetical protein
MSNKCNHQSKTRLHSLHRVTIRLEAQPTKSSIPEFNTTQHNDSHMRIHLASHPRFQETSCISEFWIDPVRKCVAPSTVYTQQCASRAIFLYAIGHLVITNNGRQLLPYTYKPRCLDSGTRCCVMLAILYLFLVAVVRPPPAAGFGIDLPSHRAVSTALQVPGSVSQLDAPKVCFSHGRTDVFKPFKTIWWTSLGFRLSAQERRCK